ncbi:MAG: hypothetical protein LBS86_07775 [Treponema sp.]|jgi:hypothetical protein|nr:hypothetical protein [Treponema sp.]
MNEKKRNVFITFFATGFIAGYGAHGITAGRERDTLTASLERHRQQLDALGKQFDEARGIIDERDRRVAIGGIAIDDAKSLFSIF